MERQMEDKLDRLHHVIAMYGLSMWVNGQMRGGVASSRAGQQQRWAEPSSGPGATAEDGGESVQQGIYCIEEAENVM